MRPTPPFSGETSVLARSIEIGVKGRPRKMRVLVANVELNPQLDAARFKMPRDGTTDASHSIR